MLRTTIRNGISTVRIAQHLNARLLASGLPPRKTNLNVVIDTGKQCTIAGEGESYEEFLRSGIVKFFTGWGEKPALSKDPHYAEAPLRLMNFVDTYGNDEYQKSENFIFALFP